MADVSVVVVDFDVAHAQLDDLGHLAHFGDGGLFEAGGKLGRVVAGILGPDLLLLGKVDFDDLVELLGRRRGGGGGGGVMGASLPARATASDQRAPRCVADELLRVAETAEDCGRHSCRCWTSCFTIGHSALQFVAAEWVRAGRLQCARRAARWETSRSRWKDAVLGVLSLRDRQKTMIMMRDPVDRLYSCVTASAIQIGQNARRSWAW